MALGPSAEEVLTTTRGVRRRLDLTRPVDRQLLADSARVAQQAPSGRNRQRWDFLFVTDPERRSNLAELWRLGLTHPTGDDDTAPSRQDFRGAEWQAITDSVDHLVGSARGSGPARALRPDRDPRLTCQPGHPSRHLGAARALCGPLSTAQRWAADLLGITCDSVMQCALIPVAHHCGRGVHAWPASRDYPGRALGEVVSCRDYRRLGSGLGVRGSDFELRQCQGD